MGYPECKRCGYKHDIFKKCIIEVGDIAQITPSVELDCSIADASEPNKFTYVDVVSKGCEGWLNLFFGEQIICLVDNKDVADQMRQVLDKKQ